MSQVPVNDASARRAALVVHGMSDADRDWMLASLPPAHRSVLAPLLEELQALGLARDAGLLASLATAGPQPPATTAGGPSPLSKRHARRIAQVCSEEPPALAAQLLAACPQWRVPVLACMADEARAAVEAAGSGLVVAPALAAFLRGAARQELAQLPPLPMASWWQRTFRAAREAS